MVQTWIRIYLCTRLVEYSICVTTELLICEAIVTLDDPTERCSISGVEELPGEVCLPIALRSFSQICDLPLSLLDLVFFYEKDRLFLLLFLPFGFFSNFFPVCS